MTKREHQAREYSNESASTNPASCETRLVYHKTTMVLLECKLYETLHPETWDWEEICMASGIVIKPSESIKVVPPRHNGTELGHHLRSLLTQEERDAVAGIALILSRLKLYPEQVGSTKQDDLDLLWRIAEGKVTTTEEGKADN